ncbi:MAG: ExbD/TolR family protein [Opitutales bacterium]
MSLLRFLAALGGMLLLGLFGGCATGDGADVPTTVVEIGPEGGLYVDGNAVTLEFLPGAVEPGKIVIDAHPDVPLERIDAVLDHLRENGFRDVAFLPEAAN